jgi:hypothetical protein
MAIMVSAEAAKQDVVDRGLVLIGDVRNGRRQRKHHMEVRHWK